jgi:ubiquinone/menaquinone biosynthesis C-methylase UbiE
MNTFWDRVAHFYDDALRGLNWPGKQLAIAEGLFSGRVLEACCGTASLALALRQRGVEVYAMDLAPRMLARAAVRFAQAGLEPARLAQADVTHLPFPDGAFDYVLVTGALGLFPTPLKREALRELARIAWRELRLLEPVEEKASFYWRRVLTWCVDGMRPMQEVKDLAPYRAVVAGSAIQDKRWLPEAMQFVQVHRAELARKPFAAFLVCMTLAMRNGESYRPFVAEFLAPVRALVKPVSEGLFAGALDSRARCLRPSLAISPW